MKYAVQKQNTRIIKGEGDLTTLPSSNLKFYKYFNNLEKEKRKIEK